MKILVTGASGYIGQRLTLRLLKDGHEVHALCRMLPKGEWGQHERLRFFTGDVQNKKDILDAMQGCSQVYHLAAHAQVWAKDLQVFYNVNVKGTVNIMEAALECGVTKVVHTSTGGVFGVSHGELITEDWVRNIDFFNDYEKSKSQAEEFILPFLQQGLNVVTVNPTRVYGPGLWTNSNAVSQLIKSYISGNWHVIPGSGKALSSFSFIDDVIQGHILAMEVGVPGERYILGGENVSLNVFFQELKALSGKHFLLVNIPLPLLLLYGWREEQYARWFGKEPLVTRKWIKKFSYDMACSSDKAIHQLGYSITPFREGLLKTINWLKEDQHVFF